MNGQLVRDVMTDRVVVVTAACGYKEIVDTLMDYEVSAVPVIDGGQRVIGVVSEADLLHKAEFDGDAPHARLFERRSRRVAKEKAAGAYAPELMTAPAVTVAPTATAGEAARLMEQHSVKRLPVVDDAGMLVGIVSRRDLLRQFLRDDADIRKDVIEGILRRTMWIDPLDIEVEVHSGRVALRGKTDRRSTARIAAQLVRGVRGVVSVTDELTWDFDDTAAERKHSMFDADVR